MGDSCFPSASTNSFLPIARHGVGIRHHLPHPSLLYLPDSKG